MPDIIFIAALCFCVPINIIIAFIYFVIILVLLAALIEAFFTPFAANWAGTACGYDMINGTLLDAAIG